MKLSAVLFIGFVALASAKEAGAQGRGRGKDDVPPASRPPAGMCRIWLENVPAAQQPAPTDCASAVRNRPAKGRVIFGDDYVATKRTDTTKVKTPPKGFAPQKGKKPLIRLPKP